MEKEWEKVIGVNDYKLFDPFLNSLNQKLKKTEESNVNIQAFLAVFNELRTHLYSMDPVLNNKRQIQFTGSFFNKIYVGPSIEYDMDICIQLPFNYKNIKIEHVSPGFVKIKAPGELATLRKSPQWNDFKSIEKWMEDDYIVKTKFLCWMQGVVDRMLHKLGKTNTGSHAVLQADGETYKLSFRTSGPACTIDVKGTCSFAEFSIDLVPVFIFNHPHWPPPVKFKPGYDTEWLAVAKPIPKGRINLPDKEIQKAFRISFPKQENKILEKKENMKSALRLLKQLKNNKEMTYIPSFYINTLFFWKIESTDDSFWQQRLSFLFMTMLQELYRAMDKGQLLYYWDKKHNLLNNLKPDQINSSKNTIKNIFRTISKQYPENPAVITQILSNKMCDDSRVGLVSGLAMAGHPHPGSGVHAEAGDAVQQEVGSGSNVIETAAIGAGIISAVAYSLYQFFRPREGHN